nr:ADP-ribosylglycohydrolase family protein [Pseudenhygromyxa sp. WMMC2535]
MLGTAIGDALGLPHEGLHPERIARRLRRRPLEHRMFLGCGLVSDDTEHTSMVARALASSGGEVEAFTRSLAAALRRWVLALPPGIGLATLRGSLRLLVGVPPERSGVDSAGNGPAMRSAILGVCAKDDAHLVALTRASTRLTHTDPRAEDGAVLIARLARQLSRGELDDSIIAMIRDLEFRQRVREAWGGQRGSYERGVSGFIVDTVPAAVYCALWSEDARGAIESAIRLGGDTDTCAAIVGALVGARGGLEGLPKDWLEGVRDWPLGVESLTALAVSLAEGSAPEDQRWLASIPRNLGMIAVILGHLLLRALGR